MLLLAGAFTLFDQPRRGSTLSIAKATPPGMTHSQPRADAAPPVKFITDEELLALFPNRSVGLIGKAGHQELVFFDQPAEP